MFLSFIAYAIIPVYTILFAGGSNWFTTNFSVLGNTLHRRDAFVLWGILVGCYYFYALRKIVRRLPFKVPATYLIPTALLLLVCAVTTPYLPEKLPLKASLHIVFSFSSAVLLWLFLLILAWHMYKHNPARRRFLSSMTGIGIISALLLIFVGIVSSALEIFFTLATVVWVQRVVDT